MLIKDNGINDHIWFVSYSLVTLKYSLSSAPHTDIKTTLYTCSKYQEVPDGLKTEYTYTCVSMYE